MFSNLALMNCEDGLFQKPDYLSHATLLSQFPQRLMIFPHYTFSNFHLLREARIVRSEFYSVLGFDCVESISPLHPQSLEDLIGQNHSHGVADVGYLQNTHSLPFLAP